MGMTPRIATLVGVALKAAVANCSFRFKKKIVVNEKGFNVKKFLKSWSLHGFDNIYFNIF